MIEEVVVVVVRLERERTREEVVEKRPEGKKKSFLGGSGEESLESLWWERAGVQRRLTGETR